MAVYFLDSSAIVKRYFQEQGHDWFEAQPPEAESPNVIFVSADQGLLTIALAEGFDIENPNNYD